MSRYIDADELIKIGLQDGAYEYVSVQEIADFPTEDVAPVVHGKWIMLNPSLARCSACGGYESTNGRDLTMKGIIFKEIKPYCPHCGAKMDLQ